MGLQVYIDAMWDNRTGIMGILPAIMKKKYKQFEEAMAWADPVFGKINEIALNHQYSCRTFPAPDCIANYLDNWNAEVYGRLWGPSEYFMQSNETGDLDLTQELESISYHNHIIFISQHILIKFILIICFLTQNLYTV